MLHYIHEESLFGFPSTKSNPYSYESSCSSMSSLRTAFLKSLRSVRLEPKIQWIQRMRNANFRGISFAEDAVSEVKTMLDEHAAGWGLKKEDDDLVLTWKGNNVVSLQETPEVKVVGLHL
uniref:Uncharacterized protein n=1 Tax=Salix viminalis TaxID=40686 RepID=A0A6N2LQF3_SALVM